MVLAGYPGPECPVAASCFPGCSISRVKNGARRERIRQLVGPEAAKQVGEERVGTPPVQEDVPPEPWQQPRRHPPRRFQPTLDRASGPPGRAVELRAAAVGVAHRSAAVCDLARGAHLKKCAWARCLRTAWAPRLERCRSSGPVGNSHHSVVLSRRPPDVAARVRRPPENTGRPRLEVASNEVGSQEVGVRVIARAPRRAQAS